MTTNVEALHDKGIVDKNELTEIKIDTINGLCAEDMSKILACGNKLDSDGKSTTDNIVGIPL